MTSEQLKKKLDFDPKSGIFTWKVSTNNRVRIGDRAGYVSKRNGYIQIKIDKKLYLAHRLAWLYVYGEFPSKEIDHVDHDRTNNSIENLREVTRGENSRNTKVRSNSYSGATGVYWDKASFKWRVMIHDFMGKPKHIGYFKDFENARAARVKAQSEYNYHPNHGSN